MPNKVGTDLYVLKKNANAILTRMNMDPPMSGFFQEMSNVSTRIKAGIRCTKKPPNFLMNDGSPEKASRAKNDKNTIKIMASTLGIQMSLSVFIFPSIVLDDRA
jgi:hypothetical protein